MVLLLLLRLLLLGLLQGSVSVRHSLWVLLWHTELLLLLLVLHLLRLQGNVNVRHSL
jgi:hypothetical protein